VERGIIMDCSKRYTVQYCRISISSFFVSFMA
jgi:hypothetical protein